MMGIATLFDPIIKFKSGIISGPWVPNHQLASKFLLAEG